MSEKEPDFLDEMTAGDDAADEVATPDDPDTTDNDDEALDDEQGDETPVETPATEPDKAEQGILAGIKAEREKRQQYERELDQARRELAELKQQQAQPGAELPQFFDDPEAFVSQVAQQAEQRAQQRLYAALDDQVRSLHSDYDDVLALVREEAQKNPSITQQIFSAPNPALAAYNLGKKMDAFRQMQDPETYRAKIVAEERAKWDAELKAKADARRAAADSIPPDLAGSRNAAADTAAISRNPVDELFPRN